MTIIFYFYVRRTAWRQHISIVLFIRLKFIIKRTVVIVLSQLGMRQFVCLTLFQKSCLIKISLEYLKFCVEIDVFYKIYFVQNENKISSSFRFVNLTTPNRLLLYLIYINSKKIQVESKKNAFPVLWIGIYYYLCTRFRFVPLAKMLEIKSSLNARSK